MSAITPDAAKPEFIFANSFQGLVHRRYAFISQVVNNMDTFDTNTRLVHTAWQPYTTGHSVAASINGVVGDSEVIFTTAFSNRQGWLHIWSTG